MMKTQILGNLSKMEESDNTYSFYLPDSQSNLGMEGSGGSPHDTPAVAALQALPSLPSVADEKVVQVANSVGVASGHESSQTGETSDALHQQSQSDLGRDLFNFGVALNQGIAAILSGRDVFVRR